MGLYNKQIIDYSRQVLLPVMTKPQVGLALYPLNTSGTTLTVNVTSSTVVITYISSSTQTSILTYTNLSVEDLCLKINALGYPVKAVAIISNTVLQENDLLSTGGPKQIPIGFSVYDRCSDSGVYLRTKKVSIRRKSTSQIRVVQPYMDAATLPWYPRVQVGSFAHKTNGRVYFFSVPEYDSQSWSIKYGRPFKDVTNETPRIHSASAIQLSRTPLFWNGENIAIYDGDVPLTSANILDIDIYNGIIYFDTTIESRAITVDYSYKEETYEYKDININCHFQQNPTLIGKVVLLYSIPSSGPSTEPRKKTIYHIVASSIEEAIDSITVDTEHTPIAILGAYGIQQVYGSDKVSILDTRVYGGGLVDIKGPVSPIHRLDDVLEPEPDAVPIENTYSESNSFWDIGKWDGEVYPGAAAVLVDLPEEIKDTIDIDSVKKKATKFLAAGVYPLFEFSSRPLPDVVTYSTQISCYNTGISGFQFLPIEYELPGDIYDSSWVTDYDRSVSTIVGNKEMICPSSLSGYYLPYLKSSPIAGIEWKERSYTVNLNSQNDTKVYSEWKTNRFFDTREVANHQLIKNNLVLDTSKAGIEYKDIVIHSPFQYAQTGNLKSNIARVLSEVTSISLPLKANSEYYTPISRKVIDITDQSTEQEASYDGLHPSYRFLFELSNSDLSSTYLPILSLVLSSYANSWSLTEFIKNYDTDLQTYTGHVTGATGVILSSHVEDVSRFLHLIREYYGTGHAYYATGIAMLESAMDILSTPSYYTVTNGDATSNYYIWPYYYTYTGNGYSGIDLSVPEVYGIGFSDINPAYEDHFLLKNSRAIISTLQAYPSVTGAEVIANSSFYENNHLVLGTLSNRLNSSIVGPLTNSGHPTVDTWFTRHDRLGEYAGTICRDLLDTYTYLKDSIVEANAIEIYSYSGLDTNSLNNYFDAATNLLRISKPYVDDILENGGHTPREMINLIYGYGWYAVNRDSHYEVYTGATGIDYTSGFEQTYHRGIDTIIKSMVTYQGQILETDYVDFDSSSGSAYAPSLIFNALIPGLTLDRPNYLAKAAAVFNTVTGNYYMSGLFYSDARKLSTSPGAEINISYELARLYKSI